MTPDPLGPAGDGDAALALGRAVEAGTPMPPVGDGPTLATGARPLGRAMTRTAQITITAIPSATSTWRIRIVMRILR